MPYDAESDVQRYRRAQVDDRGVPINPGAPMPTYGWEAFFGSLLRQKEEAAANGMGFRANLGSLGQPEAEVGGGGVQYPSDRGAIAGNLALGNYASQSGAQQLALKGAADQQRDAAIEDMRKSEAEHVAQSMEAPPRAHIQTETDNAAGQPEAYTLRPAVPETERERLLAQLPPPLRAQAEAQYAAQDLAKQKEQAAEASNPLLTSFTGADGKPTKLTDDTGAPLQGADVLSRLSPAVRNQVQGVLDGRQMIPTGTASKDPYWKSIIQIANQADPSFDAVNYNARASTRKDFTSGKAAGQINAINTAVGHLHDLSAEGEKLGNFGMDWVNKAYNMLTPGGSKRGVALNNFNTLKEGVGTELMRVWRQVGAGSEKEIQDWKSTIDDAKSPEELRGAFSTIGGMLESKLDALDKQYKDGMGTNAVSPISPESRAKLDALQGGKAAKSSGGTVRLRAPNGAERDVPADQVDHYLAQGAKRVG